MTLFDLFDANMDALKTLGSRAVAEARRDGVAAYYMDPALGAGLVRELPDGTRERLERAGGEFVVVARYGPRA